MKHLILGIALITGLFAENYIYPISKTEFVVGNNNGEKVVDLYGKNFIVISLREIGADGRVYAIDDFGTPWLTGIISSGAKGHRTPAGVYNIKYKRRFHMSTVYPAYNGINNMNRSLYFTNSGHAVHQGNPNASSHGCVHVGSRNMKSLWDWSTGRNITIVVIRDSYIDFVRHEL